MEAERLSLNNIRKATRSTSTVIRNQIIEELNNAEITPEERDRQLTKKMNVLDSAFELIYTEIALEEDNISRIREIAFKLANLI